MFKVGVTEIQKKNKTKPISFLKSKKNTKFTSVREMSIETQ